MEHIIPELQAKILDLEVLIADIRDTQDNSNLSKIHSLISEAATLAGVYN